MVILDRHGACEPVQNLVHVVFVIVFYFSSTVHACSHPPPCKEIGTFQRMSLLSLSSLSVIVE